jgi:hypothetical protein
MTQSTLPTHPRTGLQAVGYRRNGDPIWPILGGSESTSESPPAADGGDNSTDPPADPAPPADPGKTFTQADLDKQIEQRLARERKKFDGYDDLKAKAARLDEIEKANATDLEKAVQSAKDETRAEVARGFGERLVRGVMKAQLEQSMKPADAAALLDDLNLSKFVGDDGEVDEDAIAKTVARLAPKGRLDLGQGAHGNAPSFDQQIADATKAGNFALVIALKEQQHASRTNKS